MTDASTMPAMIFSTPRHSSGVLEVEFEDAFE